MSIEVVNWSSLTDGQSDEVLKRPDIQQESLTENVRSIIADVKARGDVALLELSQKYDDFSETSLRLPTSFIQSASSKIDAELKQAIDEAYERIFAFHSTAKPSDSKFETAIGVTCEYRYRGFDAVGLYIPGGSAPLISTVLMTAIPAQIAEVGNIQICTPAKSFAEVNVGIRYAAAKCGVENIYCVGGAQAVAALAYGTDSVAKVQKIFGPGNSWVTEAKQQVAFDPRGAAIDMPAGPSEVLVIADASANPEFVAMDLLSQLEHGPDSQAVLLSDNEIILKSVVVELERFTAELSRSDILERSVKNVRLILVDSVEDAIDVSNQYAPEHLLLQVNDARQYLEQVRNSGSTFVGHYTPESLGDYCSGTNHVLPTYGFARSYNGLSVMDYMQRMTIQEATATGIQNIGPCAVTLAEAEGLDAHKRAVELRLGSVAS